MTTMKEAGEKFHAHVDQCQRCKERPFDLCELGAQLLKDTASAVDAGPLEVAEPEPTEIVIGPEDRKLFVATLKSILASRTRAIGAADGAILRMLIDTLEDRRASS